MFAIACVVGSFAFCLTQHSLPQFCGVILLLSNANMWHWIRERCEKENKQLEVLVVIVWKDKFLCVWEPVKEVVDLTAWPHI